MKQKFLLVFILSIMLVTGTMLISSCAEKVTKVPIIDIYPQEAFSLIKENIDNPDFVILDVRTPEEFSDGHIEDAINIDFNSQDFRDNINRLDRSKTYLVYCRTANRSRGAVNIMEELEFTQIYHILGGIVQWEKEGLPIIK